MAYVACWADKGRIGKTTSAALCASRWKVPLINLDPQGDSPMWAKRVKHPHRAVYELNDVRAILPKLRASEKLYVVDCPPMSHPSSLYAVGMANAVIIPTAGGDPDVRALARVLELVRTLQLKGNNPTLGIGVFLNFFRETRRARAMAEKLAEDARPKGYRYLGHLGLRTDFEEVLTLGKDVITGGGIAAHEARKLLIAIEDLIGIELESACNHAIMIP